MTSTPFFRIGQGLDLHRFTDGTYVVLGGVKIPHTHALEGHSDADVLIHAVMDALLGAAGLPDIGHLFPNTDQSLKGIDSILLLERVWEEISGRGYTIGNIDCTVLAEAPKIAPHIDAMKKRIGEVLKVAPDQIGIKATTTEKMGAIGRKEGIFASAVALLLK